MQCKFVLHVNSFVEGLFPFGDEVGDKKLTPTLNGCSGKLDLECDRVPAFSRVISSFYVS